MQISHRILLSGAVAFGSTAMPAAAETIDLTVTLPRMTVAEYHRPYVAVWLEKVGGPAKTLTVWYDQGKRNNGGAKWLRDIRLWWRASGRSLSFPADGVSGATRAPGPQKISLNAGALDRGQYVLAVEAARESGGREVVKLPFTWSGSNASGKASGTSELGAISLVARK